MNLYKCNALSRTIHTKGTRNILSHNHHEFIESEYKIQMIKMEIENIKRNKLIKNPILIGKEQLIRINKNTIQNGSETRYFPTMSLIFIASCRRNQQPNTIFMNIQENDADKYSI